MSRVLVTAGTQGLGRAIVEAFIKQGDCVYTCARTEKDLNHLKKELGDHLFVKALDLMSLDEVKNFAGTVLSEFSGLDVLVFNPPHSVKIPISRFTLDDWQKSFVALYLSMIAAVDAVLPSMKKQKQGSIVVISSVGAIEPIDNMPASSVLRGGMGAWVKLMAREYGPLGIRFNTVQPGFCDSPAVRKNLLARAQSLGKSVEEVMAELVKNVPLRRMGSPEDIAQSVLFLASDKAAYITGTNLLVDGGMTRG